jgi:CBS domain-containing protein
LLVVVAVWRALSLDDTFGAVWMGMIAYFLYNAASSSLEQERVAHAVAGVRAGSLMSTQFRAAHPRATLASIVQEHMLPHNARAVAVVDGGRLLGLVSIADLRKVEQRDWSETPVERVMTTAADLPLVSPGSRLMTAIERFGSSDLPAIPVVDDGVLVGMLEREAVASYVRMREMLGLDTRR